MNGCGTLSFKGCLLDLQGRTPKLRLQQPTKHAFFNAAKQTNPPLVLGPLSLSVVLRFVQRSGSVYLYAFVAFGEFVAVLIGLCLDDMKKGVKCMEQA